MALGEEESAQRQGFEKSLPDADVTVEELWLRYFAMGGQAGQFEVEAYIHGAMALPALQRDVLAHALNERLDEISSTGPRAPYSHSDDGDNSDGGSSGNGSSSPDGRGDG